MSKTINPSGNKSVVFFGNERLATGVSTTVPTLQALLAHGYDVKAVVANFESGKSRNARSLEIAGVANKHGIPLLLPKQLTDIKQELKACQAKVGILVAYGKVIPEDIISLFPAAGIINIHPSLLPQHRGPTPIESAILDGDNKTGVSIMKLSAGMDAGPVYAQSEIALSGKESKQELADSLLEIGQAMIIDMLPDILDGTVVAAPQNDSKATYDKQIAKTDGTIDWHKPAVQLERQVRAFMGWPGSRARLGYTEVIITKAQVVDDQLEAGEIRAENKKILVGTSRRTLQILSLKPAGKKEMSAAAFLAGYKIA